MPVLEADSADDVQLPAHEVALVVAQASEIDWLAWIADGVAVKEVIAAAGGAEVTVTGTDRGALVPPGPVQVSG